MAEIADTLLEAVDFAVRKRDGRVVDFDRSRIERAIEAAFRAELGLSNEHSLPPKIETDVSGLTDAVIDEIEDELHEPDDSVDVERIQDKVEIQFNACGPFCGRATLHRLSRRTTKKPAYLSGQEEPQDPNAPKTARANSRRQARTPGCQPHSHRGICRLR